MNWVIVVIMSIFVVAPTIGMAVAVLLSRRSPHADEYDAHPTNEKPSGKQAE